MQKVLTAKPNFSQEMPPAQKVSSPQLRENKFERNQSVTLKLDENRINSLRSAQKSTLTLPAERLSKFNSAQPFRRSLNTFPGAFGTNDFLPDIPDGDITLLNAKADKHAVFVRRVALQVFGALRKMNWSQLTHSQLRSLQKFSTVEAIMSKSGKLISVRISDSSGLPEFDQITKKAAEIGAWDQNPPPDAAAEDNNIHFIFNARSWSKTNPNGPGEQRWLLLGIGLL